MKREPELDMESVLEVFRDNDERVRGFLENGTATEHDDDPVRSLSLPLLLSSSSLVSLVSFSLLQVRTIESLTWRIQSNPIIQDQQQNKPVLKPVLR